ncbi:hypothetical protein ACWDUL_34395 [Nocardia niigatensis]
MRRGLCGGDLARFAGEAGGLFEAARRQDRPASVDHRSDCPQGTDWSYTAKDLKVNCVHNEKSS